ncbi:MAG TPA: ribonuclease H family protein [Candidatus Paceibacterota bacterium]|jgi:ribonuclease HI|nr:ribonuclease H family protein [Candidatus Paceibacterota bacterium]
MAAARKKKYYAYFVPAGPHGVTDEWAVCEGMVKGKPGARFKAFDNRAEAEEWLSRGAMYEAKPRPKLVPGIYFDAGTGRGHGVEISVTDEQGKNLLQKALPKKELNKFGKHLLERDATNNYGELLALRYALQIAKKMRVKKIFGDSRLVIDYWSKWRIKRKELPEETVTLAEQVAKLREAFEKTGGTVERIPGGHNPADLGFH